MIHRDIGVISMKNTKEIREVREDVNRIVRMNLRDQQDHEYLIFDSAELLHRRNGRVKELQDLKDCYGNSVINKFYRDAVDEYKV